MRMLLLESGFVVSGTKGMLVPSLPSPRFRKILPLLSSEEVILLIQQVRTALAPYPKEALHFKNKEIWGVPRAGTGRTVDCKAD